MSDSHLCYQATSCQSWKVLLALQRSPCLTWESWATEVTGPGSCWRSWGTSGERCPSRISGRHTHTLFPSRVWKQPPHSSPQSDDQHHTEWHHQHPAVAQYGQVLEGSACYLCDAQTGWRAPEECPVQETTNHRQAVHLVSEHQCKMESDGMISLSRSPSVDTLCLKWAPPKNKQAKLSKKWTNTRTLGNLFKSPAPATLSHLPWQCSAVPKLRV